MKPWVRIARDVAVPVLGFATLINTSTSSLCGTFWLALAAYFLVPQFTDITPLHISEVLAFAAEQPADRLLAAFGIFAAYVVAVETWRMQKRFEVRLDTAVEFEKFFGPLASHVLAVEIYVENLLKLRASLLCSHDWREFVPLAARLQESAQSISAHRADISRLVIEFPLFHSRHEIVLNSHLVSQPLMSRAGTAVTRIGDALWFPLQVEPLNAPMYFDWIVRTNPAAWEAFVAASSAERSWLLAAAGGLRGGAMGALFKPTIWTFLRARRVVTGLAAEAANK